MERGTHGASAQEILRLGLARLGLPLAGLERFEELCQLLESWASRLNLTAHRSAAAIAQRLVLDAVALSQILPDTPPPAIADLGSGAGFPGLPLAILWPECQITLVEARERRHHFQRTAIRALGLRNATPRLGRAESLDPTAHAVVVAQAAAQPAVALSWMSRWSTPPGWLVIPGSEHPEPFEPPPGVFHVETRSYQVPGGGAIRTAWIGRSGLP